MTHPYNLHFIPPIPKIVRTTTRQYLEALDDISPITQELDIYVVPLHFVDDSKRHCSLGLFYWWLTPPQIHITGAYPKWLSGEQRAEWLHDYKDTLCHEYAHYEQWRDGRKVCEDGVNRRAKRLVSLVEELL